MVQVHVSYRYISYCFAINTYTCADLEGGSGGSGPPLEFAKLNIADITRNEKISYFSFLCTSTIIRQGWTPPGKIFWIRAWYTRWYFEINTRGVASRDCFKVPSGICSKPLKKYTVTNTYIFPQSFRFFYCIKDELTAEWGPRDMAKELSSCK